VKLSDDFDVVLKIAIFEGNLTIKIISILMASMTRERIIRPNLTEASVDKGIRSQWLCFRLGVVERG
jgi:hypothetical protein